MYNTSSMWRKVFQDYAYHFVCFSTSKNIKDSISKTINLVKSDSAAIMSDSNVNRFYNYFEIIKSLDKAGLIDNQTAENILPFFEPVGSKFNYIEKVRLNYHKINCGSIPKCPDCNCGSLLDGYEYVFSKFLQKQITPTQTNCIKDDD